MLRCDGGSRVETTRQSPEKSHTSKNPEISHVGHDGAVEFLTVQTPGARTSPLSLHRLSSEGAMTLKEVASFIGQSTGRRPALSTVYRWANKGQRGVRLEVLRVGGSWLTTRDSVEAFCAHLTAVRQAKVAPLPAVVAAIPNAAARRVQPACRGTDPAVSIGGDRRIEQAKDFLAERGVLSMLRICVSA
jgi:hypothetical protein